MAQAQAVLVGDSACKLHYYRLFFTISDIANKDRVYARLQAHVSNPSRRGQAKLALTQADIAVLASNDIADDEIDGFVEGILARSAPKSG